MSKYTRPLIALSLLPLLPLSINAEEATLDQVITSASSFEQELKDAPASVSVITGKELEEKSFRDLGDAIANTPGVSIDQHTGKTGGYEISIRGLPSAYTLILTDGKRGNTTNAAFPNSFSTVTTSFIPPKNAIERVEVLRGPASTLYGSDAIGGVVNVILKRNFSDWNGSFTAEGTIQENNLFGNIYGASFFAQGPLSRIIGLDLNIRASNKYRESADKKALSKYELKDSSSKTINFRENLVGLAQGNGTNIGARLGGNLTRDDYIYIDIDNSTQWYDNSVGKGLLGTFGGEGGYSKNLWFIRNNANITHEGNYLNIKTTTSLQYNATRNKGRLLTRWLFPDPKHPRLGEERGILAQDVILENKSVMALNDTVNLSFGGSYWLNSLYDRINFQSPFNTAHNLDLFAEDEASFGNFILTTGARANYNNRFGFHISPRAYGVYNATDNLTLKGGISSGYRTPDPNQATNGIIGLTAQGKVPIHGNPKLKPEESYNAELGVLHDSNVGEISFTGFYVRFINKFASNTSIKDGGTLSVGAKCVVLASDVKGSRGCAVTENVAIAHSYGLESSYKLKPIALQKGKISGSINYTINKSEELGEKNKNKGLPLERIPLHSANLDINYALDDTLDFYLKSQFRAGQLRKEVKDGKIDSALAAFKKANPNASEFYKPYAVFDIGSNYEVRKNMKLSFGILNLLGTDFTKTVDLKANQRSTSGQQNSADIARAYNYIRDGRRYFISLTTSF
ncbi:MAG: TonB-dependent receptor [Helicobacter sp.]|nr:TonB-dependent receptor [Helicobacter sp.]